MLTSKPMYKKNKCMWGCITWCKSCIAIKHCVCVCACSQDLKLVVKQVLELLAPSSFRAPKLNTSQLVICFRCAFSFAYAITNYGCCCSCCSCNTKVEKNKIITTIQEHKKPTSKRNPTNSKLGKICRFQH